MGRPDFPRTIVDFQERFSDEAACLEYLAASRWPEGYRCPTCGGEHAWVLERRQLWECARCHHQTSVTAGTVMHGLRRRLGGRCTSPRATARSPLAPQPEPTGYSRAED